MSATHSFFRNDSRDSKDISEIFLRRVSFISIGSRGFGSIANEPAALKQRITIRAAQNVDYVEVVDAEWKRGVIAATC